MEFVDYFDETKAYLSWIGSILVVVKVFISTHSSNSTCDKFRKSSFCLWNDHNK